MDEMAKVEFESYPNVRVITIRDLIGISRLAIKNTEEIMYSINHFLRVNPCDHIFIDEMINGRCEFPGSVKTICMTMKVDEYSIKEKKKWLVDDSSYLFFCGGLLKYFRF